MQGLKGPKAFIYRGFGDLGGLRSHNGDRSKGYKGIRDKDIRMVYRGIEGAV